MNNERIDLLLLSLPSKVMDYPCLSLPALSGFLKSKEINVVQEDLNIEIKNLILTESNLILMYEELIPLLLRANMQSSEIYASLKEFYSLLKSINKKGGFKRLIKVKQDCQERKYRNLFENGFPKELDCIFAISKFCDFLFSFIGCYYEVLKRNHSSFFLIKYIEQIELKIKERNPKLLGFTMITTQNNFTLWFSNRLKEKKIFQGPIVIGGAQPTKYGSQYLIDNPQIDFVLKGEGEHSLWKLVNAITEQNCSFHEIPRLIYRKNGNIIENGNTKFLNDSYKSTFPSYEGFNLKLYLSPVLPILASSNCPWRKCSFCAHRTSFKEDYNRRDIENVVSEMEYMNKKYGTTLFHFADETIDADFGAAIATIIYEKGLPFYWMSFGRLDRDFNEEYLSSWYKGGARVVEWGLESGSQTVLDNMKKGISVEQAQTILHIAGELGIKNKLLTWHNYPGETIEDLVRTINFVRKNVYSAFATPMLTLKQKLALQVGSELYDTAFLGVSSMFKKILLPPAVYSINAGYLAINKGHIKSQLIDGYIEEMSTYCSNKKIFIASNENVSFDLVMIEMREEVEKNEV